MGEASYDVCSAVGLASVVGLLATCRSGFGAGHQLGIGLRVIIQRKKSSIHANEDDNY